MSKTLYVTDLDGTLLNNGSFVTQYSADIISDLTAEGAMISVATARTPATVVPLLDFTVTNVPYIVMTGAALFDRSTMSYIHRRIIPEEDCMTLNEIFRRHDINPFIYYYVNDAHLLVYHYPSMNQQEHSFYLDRKNLALKKFTFEPVNVQPREAMLYFAIGHKEVILSAADEIDATGRFSVSCYPDIFATGIFLLEVFTAGVSKADAILELKEMVGADRLVTFGDNLNDIPMMEVSDLAVAVSNAQPRVKAIADIVIGPNFDDSVAKFILHDFTTA